MYLHTRAGHTMKPNEESKKWRDEMFEKNNPVEKKGVE